MSTNVLNYLQLNQLSNSEIFNYLRFIQTKILNKYINSPLDLYAQAFNVKLISEYIDLESSNWCGNSLLFLEEFITDDFYINNRPRTFDEFITDCQRLGIQLYWKEKHDKD